MRELVGAATTPDNPATASEETPSPYDIGPSHTPESEPETETVGTHTEEAPHEKPLKNLPEPETETAETETVKCYPTRAQKPPQMYGY